MPVNPVIAGGEIPPNSLSVRCSATISAQPDTVYVVLYITGDGMLTEDAVRNVTAKSDEIRNMLTKAFPELKQMEIVRVKLGEKSSRVYRSDDAVQPPRPEVINRLTITMDANSSDDLPKIVDTALRAGATFQVSQHAQFAGDLSSVVGYGVADPKKLQNDLWSKALKEAEDKASELAKIAGGTVGDLISVAEEPGSIYEYGFVRTARGRLPTRYFSFANEPIDIGTTLRVIFGFTAKVKET
jgi:uncharacterized protein YggE